MPDNTVLCRRKREEVLVTVVFIRGVNVEKSKMILGNILWRVCIILKRR